MLFLLKWLFLLAKVYYASLLLKVYILQNVSYELYFIEKIAFSDFYLFIVFLK